MTDSLKTIIAALVALLEGMTVGGEPVFKRVGEELASAQLAEFPAASIFTGGARPTPNITNTIEMRVQVTIRIYCATSSADLCDINDLVTDALCADPQLGGTCMGMMPTNFDPPITWQGKPIIIDRQVDILYRRDF